MAQRLRRATTESAEKARDGFLSYWHAHGARHFRSEEEELLPAYARYGDPEHPLVVRVLLDHVWIRLAARRLEAGDEGSVESLRELGSRLAGHVRLEERKLFPLIEDALPDDELALLAGRLAEADAG